MPNIRPIPVYLSEDDAVTVDMFMQSEYACDYMIDTRNIHWGGEVHRSHVFDIYAKFSPTQDPVKTRLDMIKFVTANLARYNWDAHLYLTMHGLNLESWVQRMMFWENGADALAIYSLSDMLGIHTMVLTKSKPWTTVSGDFQGNVHDLLRISEVILVYLGQDRYARLWKKSTPIETSYIGPNFNYAPMANSPATLTEEFHTAQTLLELHGDNLDSEEQNKLENSVISVELLSDAMDKVVDHLDTCPIGKLNVPDAMDRILEPSFSDQSIVLHVETEKPTSDTTSLPALRVETKPCTVKLTRLETILTNYLYKVPPTTASDLPAGEHFTRSRSAHTPVRTGRKPRRVSTGVKYDEIAVDPRTSNKPKSNKPAAKPKRFGPSAGRISSRNKSSKAPVVRLPAIKVELPDVPDVDEASTVVDSNDTNESQEDDIPLSELAKKLRGTFTTREHVLEKKVVTRKYRCRMCKEQLPSCRALTVHHQTKHGIIYCDVCGKAFNNPRSLTKHLYQHKKNKQHVCNKCNKDFPFASQLTTHKLTHRKKPNQVCMFPKCGKRFKSKSDLNCHAISHTKPWLKCTDCPDYKTKDKRNFESHRLTHSRIEKYFCEKCGKGFTFNTQKRRHVAKNKCG